MKLKKDHDALEKVRTALQDNADEKTVLSARRFFKADERVRAYGIKSAVVRKIARDAFSTLKALPQGDLFALCENLWASGYIEEIGVACEWSYAVRKRYERADFATFERWIDIYVSNWAACDTLCNHTIGAFVEMYPEFVENLKAWTGSENRWKKRAAAVTLIVPARKGLFLSDIFEIADALISSSDDLVQKGYGWALKVASEAYTNEVLGFVLARKTTMPRTAFRYAVEKMPPELRAKAMKN